MQFVAETMQFFREVKSELSKVVWPGTDELVGSVIIVLFLVCVFAIYLGIIDFGFYQLAQYVFAWYGV